MADTPVSPLAAPLAALPSSQAMVERAFSSAGWQATDRENLSSEHLAEEVHSIRVFAHAQLMRLAGDDPP